MNKIWDFIASTLETPEFWYAVTGIIIALGVCVSLIFFAKAFSQ